MSTTATASFRRRTPHRRAPTAAPISGATGIAANVLLALFFALAEPFSDSSNAASWLGPVNDWLMVPQFAALIPVAVALGRRLPATRWVRALTAAGAVAMAVLVLAQLALVLGLLEFEVQVGVAVGAIVLLYLWLLGASLVGHRTGLLPRPVTRAGVLLGTSLPAGGGPLPARPVGPPPPPRGAPPPRVPPRPAPRGGP